MPDKVPSFLEWLELNPVTMQPEKTKKSSINPLEYLGTTASPVDNLEEFETFAKRDIPVYEDSDLDDLREARAESQGIPEVFGNAAARFYVGLIPEIIGSAGAVLDSPREVASWFGYEGEIGNALTKFADESKRTVDEDWFPIYRSKERTFMDVGDPEWWIENASSLQRSAVGFMATGAGVGAALKGAGALTKGTALLEAIGMSPNTAARVVGAGETLTTAFALNHAEGVMEGMEVYNTIYEKALNNGYSEEDAKLKASEAASATVSANRINILLNLTSASRFLKPLGNSRELLEKGWKKTAKDFLKEGVQEAAEESVNLLASEYGTAVGSGAETGVSTFMSGTDKLTTAEGAEAAFLGFLGGAGQTMIQNVANKSKYNPFTRVKDENGNWISQSKYQQKMYQEQQSLLENYKQMGLSDNIREKTNIFDELVDKEKNNEEILKALEERDEVKLAELRERDFGYRVGQAIRMGTVTQLLESVDEMTKAEQTKASAEGRDVGEIAKRGQKAKQLVEFLEKRWANNEILINRFDIKGNPDDVRMFKSYLKTRANNLNAELFLNKDATSAQEANLAQEEVEGFNADYLKGIVIPYVRKQAAELDKKGKEYADLFNPENVQERFEKYVKGQEEARKKTEEENKKAEELDNEIEIFKQTVTDAGYEQKVDNNYIDLPNIGRVKGVHVQYEGNLYRLTREGSDKLNLVPLEGNGPIIPFTREFLKENLNKLGILKAEAVKERIVTKRNQQFKEAQIAAIDSILKDYDSKKQKLEKEIQEYESQMQDVVKKIQDLKSKIREGIRDKSMKISLKSEIQELEKLYKQGEKIIEILNKDLGVLNNAQSELNGLKEFYLDSLQAPEQRFINPTQIRNELKRQEGENYFSQKEREILETSEEEINQAIFYTEKALDKLRKKQEKILNSLQALNELDKDAIKNFNNLKKITSQITELEQELKEYKEDLLLKQETSSLKKSIDMIDLHINALKKRAEKIFTKPEGFEDSPVEGSDEVIEDSSENQVYEQKKSTSMFSTTGMNVLFNSKEKRDEYDENGIPIMNQNILEKNWFERMDLEGIKEGENLQVLKYSSNPVDDKQKEINKLIREDKYKADINWSGTLVKEQLWKPIQLAILDKKSTTQLEEVEVDRIYNTLNRYLSNMGISVPFPNAEIKIKKD